MHAAPTGAPRGLQSIATTDTSITIQWWPVECTKQNSQITHYVVKYVYGSTDGSAGNSISKIVYGAPENGGIYVLVGLSLGVQYFIQVAAVNNNGETGPFSDPIIAESELVANYSSSYRFVTNFAPDFNPFCHTKIIMFVTIGQL